MGSRPSMFGEWSSSKVLLKAMSWLLYSTRRPPELTSVSTPDGTGKIYCRGTGDSLEREGFWLPWPGGFGKSGSRSLRLLLERLGDVFVVMFRCTHRPKSVGLYTSSVGGGADVHRSGHEYCQMLTRPSAITDSFHSGTHMDPHCGFSHLIIPYTVPFCP